MGKKEPGSCHEQVRSKGRVGILDRGTDRCKGREQGERTGLLGSYRRLPGTPRTGKVALRSIRPRGRWATSVRTVVGELMLPKTEMWTPCQAQPGALPLDGQEEAAGSAEDRLWPFVLPPREAAVPHGTTQLARVLGRGPWHWWWRGAPASQDHFGHDAEEQVVVPPPHLQQQRGLAQDGLLQLARVCQGTPVDLDNDVAILDAPSANRRNT